MKIITTWSTLMKRAKDLGEAKKSGDPEKIRIAQERHDEYRDMCLKADEMILPFRVGDLF